MDDNDYVLAFDHFYTNNHIQILKSLLPFIGSNNSSNMLPVIIKYMELQYTISVTGNSSFGFVNDIRASSFPSDTEPLENIENIYKAVHKYLAPNEEKNFNQLINTLKTMKNLRDMQQMMEMFQNLNPDMDINSLLGSLSNGNLNMENMNINGFDINDIMKMFGGNDNGNK
jgi:hypothetical protein